MAKTTKPPTALTLTLDECEPGALPPVCAKCGAEATGETRVKFRLYSVPFWLLFVVSLPVFLLLSLLSRKSRVAHMPVCARHAGTWNWGGMVIALMLGLTVPTALMSLRSSSSSQPVMLLAVMGVGLLVGLVVTAGGIQPKEMGPGDMLLEGFHPRFVHAVEDDRVGGDAGRPPRASADFVTLTRA